MTETDVADRIRETFATSGGQATLREVITACVHAGVFGDGPEIRAAMAHRGRSAWVDTAVSQPWAQAGTMERCIQDLFSARLDESGAREAGVDQIIAWCIRGELPGFTPATIGQAVEAGRAEVVKEALSFDRDDGLPFAIESRIDTLGRPLCEAVWVQLERASKKQLFDFADRKRDDARQDVREMLALLQEVGRLHGRDRMEKLAARVLESAEPECRRLIARELGLSE